MKVYNVNNLTNSVAFRAQNCTSTNNKSSNISFSQKYRPISSGLNTAASWFGFGVILDAITRKIQFFKSPVKNSIAINTILGLVAGTFTAYKALKKD